MLMCIKFLAHGRPSSAVTIFIGVQIMNYVSLAFYQGEDPDAGKD